MHIGINTLFLIPDEVGGSETYLRAVLRQFATQFPRMELVLFTNIENDPVLRKMLGHLPQMTFYRLPFRATNRPLRILHEQITLPAAVYRAKIDVLWSPGYTMPFYASCPQVVTIHDMQYKEFPHDWTPLARLANAMLIPMAIRRSARVIAVSEFGKQQILKYVSVPPEHIFVTYEGVDESFGQTLPEAEKQKRLATLLSSNTPYILCVANTYPHKNVHTLIEAYAQLMHDIPHQLVLISIPGLGEPLLQRTLESLKDRQRVVRLQHLVLEDVIAVYQGADLFVFPSLYEGFGLPVLEAMKAGVPVIATDKASIPEIGAESIWYFDGTTEDLVEKIRELFLLSSEEKSRLTDHARHMAAKFTWQKTAEKTRQCFREVLDLTLTLKSCMERFLS